MHCPKNNLNLYFKQSLSQLQKSGGNGVNIHVQYLYTSGTDTEHILLHLCFNHDRLGF